MSNAAVASMAGAHDHAGSEREVFAITVIRRLASSKGRNDEVPNIELAVAIVKGRDTRAVRELVEHLRDDSRAIQNDCIKVLCEIGERRPGLIAPFADEFIDQVSSKMARLRKVYRARAGLVAARQNSTV